ncbi:uncharacterized protein LOC113213776 [Frankliniella occidentalis]|uniref:Uncharacterized protein LOC113213776 n=1 Tax=Frankliniella occidentalis TaxID=133901 RepID=A0A6J1T760_FRAOC|nr:uncharacterized protein LOC113213776 [Frankliniella occidentalis]
MSVMLAFQNMLTAAVREAVQKTPRRTTEERVEDSSQSKNVQVGRSLLVEKTAWNMARLAPSPGRMVGILLKEAFSRRRLIRSTYAGQVRNKVAKPALKKYQKMQDIHNFVLERFPHTSEGAFGSHVNSFLGEKAKLPPEQEYVNTSESEMEDN